MAFENLKEHLITAVATSALLGGGAALVSARIDLARHDERITRIEKLDERMTKLDDRLVETQLAIAKSVNVAGRK